MTHSHPQEYPSPPAVRLVLNACSAAEQWDIGLSLLAVEGLPLDVKGYTVAIKICGRAGRYLDAVALLRRMEEEGLVPTDVNYSAAIDACARNGRWELGLGLLKEMTQKGMVPNMIAYGAAIAGCFKAKRWQVRFDINGEDIICWAMDTEDVFRRDDGGGGGGGGGAGVYGSAGTNESPGGRARHPLLQHGYSGLC